MRKGQYSNHTVAFSSDVCYRGRRMNLESFEQMDAPELRGYIEIL
jgi:hypothetical protein